MPEDKLKFEEALKRLEEIVSRLENGSDDLDSIVTLYQEGNQLIKKCSQKLQQIENKIETISKDSTGNINNKIIHNEE